MVEYKSYKYGTKQGETVLKSETGFSTSGLITKGALLFIVYLFISGAIAWSGQLQMLAIIVAVIWWLTR